MAQPVCHRETAGQNLLPVVQRWGAPNNLQTLVIVEGPVGQATNYSVILVVETLFLLIQALVFVHLFGV